MVDKFNRGVSNPIQNMSSSMGKLHSQEGVDKASLHKV
jgi:hypothetical protein